MSTAIRSAACGLRLPTRTWSIQSRPSSIVNSMSQRSAKWRSRRSAWPRSSAATVGQAFVEDGDRLGRVGAGDDVLALRVEQHVAIELGFAGRRIAGEGDAGRRVGPAVAEHHRLDRHRGAEVVRDPLLPSVGLRPIAVPRAEDGLDRESELLPMDRRGAVDADDRPELGLEPFVAAVRERLAARSGGQPGA